jgi:hypothetical protein
MKLTIRQRDRARKFARAGHTADYISSVLDIPLVDAEKIIAQVTADRNIVDPELLWAADRQRMELNPPTKELFVELFSRYQATAHDNERKAIRERIVLEATNIVRTVVASHVRLTGQGWAFDDLESTATIAAIEAIDALLVRTDNSNPGSYIWDAVHGAVVEPDSDLHSRQHRIVKPRGEKGKHVRTESPWPQGSKTRDSDKMFGEREEFDPSGQRKGQHRNGKPLHGADPSNDDLGWGHLVELFEAGVIDDREIQLMDALCQGFTYAECANIFSSHVSSITARVAGIKEKIQAHETGGTADS